MASSRLAFVLRAFGSRNYRLFFGGQIVSLIGTWMTTTATSWLVYRLTGSAMVLGLVGFAGQFPAFLVAPLAGTVVDHWDKHRLLVITQAVSMAQSFALAALTLTGVITVPMVVALLVVQAVVNAFDMPCRQAFVVQLVPRPDLANAIALNSSMFNAARLIGPSIAGGVIATVGEGWIFLADGFSYFAVMIALLLMRLPRWQRPTDHRAGTWAQLREGLAYIAGSTPLRSVMTLLALVSLFGFPYSVLMPIFARDILGGGPHTLGWLMAATGGGALIGALFLAARPSVRGLTRIIPLAAAVFGTALIVFSFSRVLWLSLAILVVTGFGFMVQMASSNTLIQTIVDDTKRGRVMAFYVMTFLGAAPIGSLFAGTLAARIGAPWTLVVSGVCCLVASLWFVRQLPAVRAAIRPIYIRLGIVEEVTAGVQQTSDLMTPPED